MVDQSAASAMAGSERLFLSVNRGVKGIWESLSLSENYIRTLPHSLLTANKFKVQGPGVRESACSHVREPSGALHFKRLLVIDCSAPGKVGEVSVASYVYMGRDLTS